jgi:hypothetical protein
VAKKPADLSERKRLLAIGLRNEGFECTLGEIPPLPLQLASEILGK